jgi:hypothetical protein
MRTWKQGAVGRIKDEDGTFIFFRCLKYPLAQFYRKYHITQALLEGWICDAYLDVSVLRYMERLAVLKISKAELNEKSIQEDEGILGIDGLYEPPRDCRRAV